VRVDTFDPARGHPHRPPVSRVRLRSRVPLGGPPLKRSTRPARQATVRVGLSGLTVFGSLPAQPPFGLPG
jgi:hypothetical protein